MAFIAGIKSDEPEALASLITLYDVPLRQFAYLTVRDMESAADVVQEVFISLWRRRETLVISGSVADYLYRAVRNHALDVIKHEAAEARVRDALGKQFEIDPARIADGADTTIITREFADAIADAVRALTPRVREIFLMHRAHGMTYAEIAEVLGVTIATVQSQVSRAAAQILHRLAPFR